MDKQSKAFSEFARLIRGKLKEKHNEESSECTSAGIMCVGNGVGNGAATIPAEVQTPLSL